MSKIKVNEIEIASGSGITIPTGTSFTVTDGIPQASIADQAINEAKLQISNAPTNGYFLSAQSGNTGGLTWAEAGGGGKILQFVNGTDATQYELTFTSATTDTAATTAMSITPTAANSKICVNFFFGQIMSKDGSGVRIRIYRQINNGGYSILTSTQGTASGSNRPAAYAGNFGSHFDNEDINRTRTLGGLFVDSPNTTNQVDYKIYAGQGDSGTRYVYVNRTRGNGDHTYSHQTKFHWYAMEVGA